MNSKLLASILVIITLIFTASVGSNSIEKRQDDKEDESIEKLLESLQNALNENAVEELKPSPEPSTINKAVQQIVSALQQYIGAHITVLNGITRRLGLRDRNAKPADYLQTTIGLKQLQENIAQFQETVQEFAKQINGILTRGGPPNGNVALTQLTKFINLWQKQVRDVSDELTKAIGGLQADDSTPATVPSIITSNPITDLFQQIFGVFQNAFQRIRDQISRLIPIQGQYLSEAEIETQHKNAINEVQKILDDLQTELQAMTQKLANALSEASKDSLKNADESKDGAQVPLVPQLIGLQQLQQLFDTFQKQLASLVNQFSRIFTGQVRP